MSKFKSILKTVCIDAVGVTIGYMCSRILTKKFIDERIYKRGFRDGSLKSDKFWKDVCDEYNWLCDQWSATAERGAEHTKYWKDKYTELLNKKDEES